MAPTAHQERILVVDDSADTLEVLQRNSGRTINLLIGPEGGFSQFELDLARQHSVQIISLGKKILRAETEMHLIDAKKYVENAENWL